MVAATQQGVVQPDVCNPLEEGDHHRWIAVRQHQSLEALFRIGKWSRTINTARLRSEKLNMRCTCCLFMLTLWSAAAGCNNRMPMCIGSFSLHSKWIGLSKRDPNSSVLRRDVESDRLIGNQYTAIPKKRTLMNRFVLNLKWRQFL